jgi:maltooligosyltrehalose trehalohydrolase
VAQSYPALGARPSGAGTAFRVWAPRARRVEVVDAAGGALAPLAAAGQGYFEGWAAGVRDGALYRYRLDGGDAFPDPASRFQPQGVHGPSMVVDPSRFPWHDAAWTGAAQERLVFYEVHVGAFTEAGTFDAARGRLPWLRDLGVTAVQLMPVADFPGRWNWGYDGAALFAPSRAYGTPDALRAFVDEAHRIGLAVFLDVVYNHFGPDGAYAPALSPAFFSAVHRTPWGPAINLDGEQSRPVRAFFIANALHWLREYHLDGLRLDAVHAIVDESPRHFLAELAAAVRGLPGPRRRLIAEDHRNLNTVLRPPESGGYGLDAVWNDDFHHQARRVLAGDADGYFVDFSRSTRDLATVLRRGWLYTGQRSQYFGEMRGTDPGDLAPVRFVHYLQNHDQVGNRPAGDRITAAISLAQFRAATAVLLFAPQLPLLFMGQEWAASTPFCYFTDHAAELGRRVTEGRKREFARFAGFGGDVPDPQDPATFLASRLDWLEAAREPHAGIVRLHTDLLHLRPALAGAWEAEAPVEGALVLRRGPHTLLAALREPAALPRPAGAEVVLTTEAGRYAVDPCPPRPGASEIVFPRPAAVILRRAGP